jgi:subtilase family serine protease
MVDLPIYIGSVPVEHLDGFDERLTASFRRIAEDGIDMTRIEMVINRDERQVRIYDLIQCYFPANAVSIAAQ